MNKTDYEKQANDFLEKTNTEFTAIYERTDKYFSDDKQARDIYRIVLKRGNRSYAFNFGQSINASGKYWLYGKPERGIAHNIGISKSDGWLCDHDKTRLGHFHYRDWDKNKNYSIPSAYDVLACITKYNPGTFDDFCLEYGYDTDSKKAEKTYQAVLDEYLNIAMLYSDAELEIMRDIA